MAKTKKFSKGCKLLSLAISVCLILGALFIPMTVAAEEVKQPTIIVAQDKFDGDLSGWDYTEGAAKVVDGKLQLNTGYNATTANLGYLQNVITSKETYLDQSVTVEVSCADFAAGNMPAIWLRVQESASGVKSGYVLTYDKTQFGITKWASNLTSLAMTSIATAFRATYSVMQERLDDSLRITFSAVGANPTVLTVSAEYVNAGDKYEAMSFENSEAAYQTAGKVALSGKSEAEGGTIVFDNFVYKSNCLNRIVTDDFNRELAVTIDSTWETYPSAESFTISDGSVTMAAAANTTGTRSVIYGEKSLEQTVSLYWSATDLEAYRYPVMWVRVQNDGTDDKIVGYKMTRNRDQIWLYACTSDGEEKQLVAPFWNSPKEGSYTGFDYSFSATSNSDGTTTVKLFIVNYLADGTTFTGEYSATDSTAELQNAGKVAISAMENGSDTDPQITFTNVKYATEIGNGWEGYPSNSDFTIVDNQLNFKTVVGNNANNKLRIQRPMSEKAVNQTASITVPANILSNNIWPFVWVRVQNADGSTAPHGYYCGKVGTNFILFKSTDSGVTQIDAPYYSPNMSLYDSFVITLTAKDNGNGGTDITAEIYGNVTAGGTASPATITYTDTTEELQGAGTVAISSYTHIAANADLDVYVDNFTYKSELITTETEDEIDILSFIKLKKYLSGSRAVIGSFADYDESGVIDADDLTTLVKHLLGVEYVGGEIIEATNVTGAATAASADYKAKISSLEDTVEKSTILNKTIYVSEDGNDSNDGKTPQTALKTPEAINEKIKLNSGDAVLFNRGDSFRISEAVTLVDGVSYGAYGEGEKPLLIGSLKDYDDETLWTTEDNKIWKAEIDGPEAGNIVFDGGKAFGYFKFNLEDVKQNGDYCYVRTDEENRTGVVYLYSKNLNPAKRFSSIEISCTEHAFYSASSADNNTIENIDMKYFSQLGVATINASDVKVSGCEISYIGGGQQDSSDGTRGARIGNGIEFFNSAQNCTVENNYLYQIFDAAITFQGSGDKLYKGFHNFEINNNLIEYSSMNFEFWISSATDTPDAKISNINFTNNILRFGGYGFGAYARENKTPHAFVLGWDGEYNTDQIENFNITGNTFDCTAHHFFRATNHIDMINVSNNSYYQCDGCVNTVIYDSGLYATDVNSLYSAITTIDKTPANVGWVNADGNVDLY